MHETGVKIVGALNQMFPTLSIMGHEANYDHVLVVSFLTDGNMIAIRTPPETDYRRHDYQRWVHQVADLIREKTS